MKKEDWHESVQGYVIDCLDWFDLKRYDRQSEKWDVFQWRNAIVKRQILAKMSEALPPKEELNNIFIYLNDDTKDDLFFSAPKDENAPVTGNHFRLHDGLSCNGLIPLYANLSAKHGEGFYIDSPKIKPSVQSLSCEFAYELHEDMGDNLLFENEKLYRYGINHDIEEITESSHQPRLKSDEWVKPYHEIADTPSGRSIAQKLVEVNLAAPKDKIIIAFECWLNKAKKDFDCPDPAPRPERNSLKLETGHFQRWKDMRLLAFIDFAYWRKMNGKERLSKKSFYLNVLFPDPKIKTSTSIKAYEIINEADWLMLPSTVSVLDAATENYPRNHPAVLNLPRP